MDKHDMIATVQSFTHCTKDMAQNVVDRIFEDIAGQLAQGNEVAVYGFGKFHRTEIAAKKGRNPRTGEEIDIPAGYRVTFRSGEALKRRLQG